MPVSGRYHIWGLSWDPASPGTASDLDESWYPTDVRIIAGDYFRSLGIELIRGDPPADVDYEAEPRA